MIRSSLILLSTTVLLSACGGGGGGGGALTPVQPPGGNTTQLALTSTNAKPAVRVAYSATVQATESGGIANPTGVAASGGDSLQKLQVQNSVSSVLTQAFRQDPFGPTTTNCAVSGSTTVSGDLANLLTFTAGDRINVDAMNCDDGFGEVLNGRTELTVTAFSGDLLSEQFLLTLDVLFIDLETTTSTDTATVNGDISLSLDTTGDPLVTISISGDSLTVQNNAGTDTLTGYSTVETADISVTPEPYTLTSSGAINSTRLAGVINYSTPVTFQGSGTDFPFAGELLITGADGTTVRLVALDNVNVRIDTDSDGDGVVETMENTTWADITP